jgi:ABC-2 type transport system permease protein
MLPFIPLAIFQILVCFVVGVILGATLTNILLSLLIFLLIALICISLGIIVGSLFSVNQVSGIGALVITIISLFSGAWTPLKVIGGIFETIGYALPFAHGVDAAVLLLSGSNFEDITNNLYFILMYTVLLFMLAILSFRWAMRKK